MAGTVTYTMAERTNETHRPCIKLVATWTSDASGDVNGTVTSFNISSVPVLIITDPDGVDVPTTLYDITLLDSDGVDILQGNGADRSATITGSSQDVSIELTLVQKYIYFYY